ncbi:MAG: hypothetical protein GXX85_14365 [Ignavibacteria bacterium]|nr:hypothetical protein [Ignavibacteria bacterium]
MKTDAILKCLKENDLPESLGLFVDIMKEANVESLQQEGFYCGDGLDVIRLMIKYFDGMNFTVPQIKLIKPLIVRYLSKRMKLEPDIQIKRLCHETGMSERTIKEYLKNIDTKIKDNEI